MRKTRCKLERLEQLLCNNRTRWESQEGLQCKCCSWHCLLAVCPSPARLLHISSQVSEKTHNTQSMYIQTHTANAALQPATYACALTCNWCQQHAVAWLQWLTAVTAHPVLAHLLVLQAAALHQMAARKPPATHPSSSKCPPPLPRLPQR
jgi:hypothetical protein